MWKNGPVNAAAVTIPALFRTSRLFIDSSVGLLLQYPRILGIEEELDGLSFFGDDGAPIVLHLDGDKRFLGNLHAVTREVGDVQALAHLAADALFLRVSASQGQLLGPHQKDDAPADRGTAAFGY